MNKFKLMLIGAGLLLCALLVITINNMARVPAAKNMPAQHGSGDACGLEIRWAPPYPLGI